MHLMTFVHIARPTGFERLLILLAQVAFYNPFFLRYLLSPRTAHRVTGYFEEERRQSSIRRRPGFVIRRKPRGTGSMRRHCDVCSIARKRYAGSLQEEHRNAGVECAAWLPGLKLKRPSCRDDSFRNMMLLQPHEAVVVGGQIGTRMGSTRNRSVDREAARSSRSTLYVRLV
jgi:hypothetical protein